MFEQYTDSPVIDKITIRDIWKFIKTAGDNVVFQLPNGELVEKWNNHLYSFWMVKEIKTNGNKLVVSIYKD
jgi:hypothetical protein